MSTDVLGLHFVHLTTYSIHYRQLQLLHPSSNGKTQLTPEIAETRTFSNKPSAQRKPFDWKN